MTIAPTITLEEAAKHPWDVIVIGAGPSGSIAARELAMGGHSVLLVDKSRFPRWKVCGSTLNLRALSVLEHTGLGELVKEHGGLPIRRFDVACRGRRCSIPLPGGAALSRESLDAALVQAAVDAGAQFLPQVVASLDTVESNFRSVCLRRDDSSIAAAARAVIMASGLGSKLFTASEEYTTTAATGSRIGAGAITSQVPAGFEAGAIYMACGKAGYVGLARVEDGQLDIGAALDAGAVRACGGLSQAVANVLTEAGIDWTAGLAAVEWRGTPALTRRARRIGGHRLLVVGDAASYVEPFTGEGIAWALSGGVAAAELAGSALPGWDSDVEQAWQAWHGRLVSHRQMICKGLMTLLRHPQLTAAVVGAIGLAPVLANPLVRRINAAVLHRSLT